MLTQLAVITTLLVQLSISAAINNKLQFEQDINIVNKTFKLFKADHEEYSELIVGKNGVIALERTATHQQESLRLLEITNGTNIVQLIFAPLDELVDCDVSNAKKYITKLTKHVEAKSHKTEKFRPADLTNEEVDERIDMEAWIAQCTDLHSGKLFGTGSTETTKTAKRHNTFMSDNKRPKKIDLTKLEENTRSKRGLMDLIYPGTKWCGRGNSAQSMGDLGDMEHTDSCCRDHDLCSNIIPAFSSKFNYFNYGLLTLSSCECDNRFKRCLQNAAYIHKDDLADLIGHLYFNIIGMSCFVLEEKDYCTDSSWWGRCLRSERKLTARVREELTY